MPKKKKKEVVRSLHYFAADGNYGSADGLSVLETTHWNDTDWNILEDTTDEYRPHIARAITESYEPGADEEALRAWFKEYGVDLSQYED